jgi:hypothetical protein
VSAALPVGREARCLRAYCEGSESVRRMRSHSRLPEIDRSDLCPPVWAPSPIAVMLEVERAARVAHSAEPTQDRGLAPPRPPRREPPSLRWRRPTRRVRAGTAESGQEPMRQRRAARRRSSLRRRRSSRFSARRWRFSSTAILLSSLLFMVRTCSGPCCPRARCPV